MTFYTRIGKRLLDFALVVLALPLLACVMAVVGLMVRMGMGAPVLFRHQRPGLLGRPFILYKFRTMVEAEPDARGSQTDAELLTPLGRFLRGTSLDELPQVFNVLQGDMSLVGPRPLLMRYLPRYTPEQARRHEVRPGITGWAQVNGRNAVSWEEKFALDVWYVEHVNLWLDLKILALTVWKVLARDAISQPGFATAAEFKGEAGESAGEAR
jgi:lipopolysaccharide/colanic/teichoic acid biosynthesis glycosyltransferase